MQYPGRPIPMDVFDRLDHGLQELLAPRNEPFGPEQMRGAVEAPLAVRRRTGLPLYCGEWGCITRTPRKARLRWYEDVRVVLEENGIAWANWDYRGGFGIKTRDGKPDRELIGILTGKLERGGQRE